MVNRSCSGVLVTFGGCCHLEMAWRCGGSLSTTWWVCGGSNRWHCEGFVLIPAAVVKSSFSKIRLGDVLGDTPTSTQVQHRFLPPLMGSAISASVVRHRCRCPPFSHLVAATSSPYRMTRVPLLWRYGEVHLPYLLCRCELWDDIGSDDRGVAISGDNMNVLDQTPTWAESLLSSMSSCGWCLFSSWTV